MATRSETCHGCPRRIEAGSGVLCPEDNKSLGTHIVSGVCLLGFYDDPSFVPKSVVTHETAKLWKELHVWALTADLSTDEAKQVALDWIYKWSKRVPCGDCSKEWTVWMKECPPDVSSPQALFAWSVFGHNKINRKLKKVELSVKEAEALYA